MWESKCCAMVAHCHGIAAFALTSIFLHKFAGKGVLKALDGVVSKWYLPF